MQGVARKEQRKNFINKLKTLNFSNTMREFIEPFIKNPENHEANKQIIIKLKEYRRGHMAKLTRIAYLQLLFLVFFRFLS